MTYPHGVPTDLLDVGINKNVTEAGSQLTWEGGRAGINKNVTEAGSQLTWEGGQGRNKQKRH